MRPQWILILSSISACSSKVDQGWRGYQSDAAPAGWTFGDDEIFLEPNGGGDLLTRETFTNFELTLEWRISEGGNSGIFFRADTEHSGTYESGPEMQILDDARHADGADPKTSAAANYALHAPLPYEKRPAGAWNEIRLLALGKHVEHWINGTKVVEYELESEEWEALVAASKFADFPKYGRNISGHIALQDHGDAVWFRKIRIDER